MFENTESHKIACISDKDVERDSLRDIRTNSRDGVPCSFPNTITPVPAEYSESCSFVINQSLELMHKINGRALVFVE